MMNVKPCVEYRFIPRGVIDIRHSALSLLLFAAA